MATTLGEKLRTAREARNVTLREVADQTRISARYLEGIEADDYRALPGGVFTKGFIRTYARFVGVDEKEALADYTRQVTEVGGEPHEIHSPRRSPVLLGNEPRSPVLTIVLALVVVGLAGLGIWYGLQWLQQQQNDQSAAAATPTPNVSTEANAAPSVAPSPAQTTGLSVQARATQEVALTATSDDGRPASYTLRANDAREFKANQRFVLRYSRYKANAFQLIVNGQPVKVQTAAADQRLQAIEMEITNENLAQLIAGNPVTTPNAAASPRR